MPNFILAGCAIALPVAISFALPVTRSHCRLRYANFTMRTHKTYVLTPYRVAPLPNCMLAGCAIALPVVICFALPVTRSHCRLRYLLCHFGSLIASPYRPICVVRNHYVGVTNKMYHQSYGSILCMDCHPSSCENSFFCGRLVTVHTTPNYALRQGWAFTHPTHAQSKRNACRTFNEQLDLKKRWHTQTLMKRENNSLEPLQEGVAASERNQGRVLS